MGILQVVLPEFDHEMGTTRRLLERVPEAEFAWKPHEKSMSLGQLAAHLANLPYWCRIVLESSSFDVAQRDSRSQEPSSREALLKEFDAHVSAACELLRKLTDAELMSPWTLQNDGDELFTLPRIGAVRTFVLNHTIHHRGQLTVYLRLKNIPVPAVYGPTADEQ